MRKNLYVIFVVLVALSSTSRADFGNSTIYKTVIDISSFSGNGNSTSYMMSVASAPGAGAYNSSTYMAALGLLPNLIKPPATLIKPALNFVDQIRTGNQTLSIILTDNLGDAVLGASVNGTVTDPDNVVTPINFTETAGNYTNDFTFATIGDYTIQTNALKSGLPAVSGSKNIYVGLVKFTNFTSDSSVFQGNTVSFRYSARDMGNISSTILPELFIYNSAGALVFSKTGISQSISGNQTIPLVQNNIMSWSVGSAPVGAYNAIGNIFFIDPDNNLVATPNRTATFTVVAVPGTSPSTTTTTTTTPSGTNFIIINQTQPETPSAELLQFPSVPVLIEGVPGERLEESVVVFNPTDSSINAAASIDGIPSDWVSVIDGSFSIGPGEEHDMTVIFDIPQNVIPGNYQGRLAISDGASERDFSFTLRINPSVSVANTDLTISRSSQVREVAKETYFVINVQNKDKFLDSMNFVENIDKSVASDVKDVIFSQRPSRIIQPDPIVEFTFLNLAPYEERNVTYYVKKIVNTTTPFAYNSIEQITTTEKLSKLEGNGLSSLAYTILIASAVVAIILVILYIRGSRSRRKVKEIEKIIVRVEK